MNKIKNKVNIKGSIIAGDNVSIGNVVVNSEDKSEKDIRVNMHKKIEDVTAADILEPLFKAVETKHIEWDKGISEEEWSDMVQEAEDHLFNTKHNDFYTKNLVIQKNGIIYVNGEELPHIPKLFGYSCVINKGSRLYINGREKINGKWKLTLRAVIACLLCG